VLWDSDHPQGTGQLNGASTLTNPLSQTAICLQQWHRGDKRGLDHLVKKHLPWIEARVRSRLGGFLRDKAESTDYVNDAMIEVLKYTPPFMISSEAQFRALVAKIIENVLRDKNDWYRARRRDQARNRPLHPDTILYFDSPTGKVPTPSRIAEMQEHEALLRLGMDILDPGDREVLVLSEWEGLRHAEVGKRLGISTAAASKRKERALSRLSDIVAALRKRDIATLLED